MIEHWVSPDQEDAELWVGLGSTRRRYPLKLRELRPLDTVTGVQNRLCNRGYAVDLTGNYDDFTRYQLSRFQADHDLPITGDADEATLDLLEAGHGC